MISKIKLIKTYPNSPELGTEYLLSNHRHISYKNTFQNERYGYIKLQNALDNSEYYEIIYEPNFKVGDFVTDGVIKGFITKTSQSLKNFSYLIEYDVLTLENNIIKQIGWLYEEDLKIALDTIELFDKIYFETDNIWVCAKNGRKQPKQITIKLYLDYIKSNNIQHFEIFETEEQAKEWFEENEIKYSEKDILKVIKLTDDKIKYRSILYPSSQFYISKLMPQDILDEINKKL
jgi:hypothetical protein